jgi:hypothetical protein
MIWFKVYIHWNKNIRLWSEGYGSEYDLLTKIITGDNLLFFKDISQEINHVEKGENYVFENSYDVGGGLSFELKITKQTTTCETWDKARNILEIPTKEFKELVENWIKFVEVNTAAFGNK